MAKLSPIQRMERKEAEAGHWVALAKAAPGGHDAQVPGNPPRLRRGVNMKRLLLAFLLVACSPPPEQNGPADTCDDCIKACKAQGWDAALCEPPLHATPVARYAKCYCKPKG